MTSIVHFPSAARRFAALDRRRGRGARPASFRVRWSSSHQRRLVSASASGRALRPSRPSVVRRSPCRRTAVDARCTNGRSGFLSAGRAPGRSRDSTRTSEKPCGRFRPPHQAAVGLVYETTRSAIANTSARNTASPAGMRFSSFIAPYRPSQSEPPADTRPSTIRPALPTRFRGTVS